MKKLAQIVFCLALLCLIVSCGPVVSQTVELNRERYVCKIDPTKYQTIKQKTILLSSIADESKNTTNFTYYNPGKTINYDLNYSSTSMSQPLASYFWYALQKGFECAGIKIEEGGPVYDGALTITIMSLTDQEIKFRIIMSAKGNALYGNDYTIVTATTASTDPKILEDRAYRMLDSMVDKILGDSGIQKLLVEKATAMK